MYDALDVAKYLIELSNKDCGIMSNLKLQKILYFTQAAFLMKTGIPCFYNRIEAWEFGPVVPDVYERYKMYNAGNIYDNDCTRRKIKGKHSKIIDEVFHITERYTSSQLVKISQNQSPWEYSYIPKACREITIDEIRKYFCPGMSQDGDVIRVRVNGGYMIASLCQDPDYPGIDVEFISDNDEGCNASRPRITMEYPTEEGSKLRALIWNDKDSEDYTDEIEFSNYITEADCEKEV